MSTPVVETAKVLPKGQITIPKDIRDALGIKPGDRLVLVKDGDHVIMQNSAMYALRMFGEALGGAEGAAAAGLDNDEDVARLLTRMRRENARDGNQ